MILDSKKSYPAFTLWEVIIAMLITSVVVTLSYGAYRQFTGMMAHENKDMEELLHLISLEKEIRSLVDLSDRIEVFGDEIFLSGPRGEASLEFSDGLMDVFLDGEYVFWVAVQDWSVVFLDDRSDIIRSFNIVCQVGNGAFTLNFRKTYMKKFLYSNGLK